MAFKLRVRNITVTTAGVPVAGPDLRTKKVQIVAPASNAGAVYYGSKGLTAGVWRVLAAGASDTHEAPEGGELDLSALRFDAANANDKVTLLYYEWEEQADAAYLLPSQVSGLQGWWKANALSLSANDPVTSWTDSSGNNKPLDSSGSARPLYKTNVQNGLPGVLFDGVNDTLEVSLTMGNYTLIWAMKLTAGGCLWWGDGDAVDEDFIMSGGDPAIYVTRGGGNKIDHQFSASWMTGLHLVVVRVGATYADFLVRRDGANYAANSMPTQLDPGSGSSARNVFCGTRDGDYPIGGHLLEGAFFNAALPLATIEQLEAYLNDKWALY